MSADQGRLVVNSLGAFQREVWKNNFQRSKDVDPGNFAMAARIGGSTVDFVLKGLAKAEEPLHVTVDLDKNDKAKALETLGQIINFVADQAKVLGQKVLPVDLGIAGFSTKSHPQHDNEELPQNLGLHLLPNFVTNSLDETYPDSSHKANLFNFFNFAHKTIQNANGQTVHKLRYQDEFESKGVNPAKDTDFIVDFKVINDTVAIGNSVLNKLSDGENVLSMVGGTGFNVGKLEGFSTNRSSFKKLESTEIGHQPEKLSKDVLNLFDKQFLRENAEHLDPEWLFAGGNNGPQGIVAYVNFLKDSGSEDFQASSLAKLDKVDGIALAEHARQGDEFSISILRKYATALGRFLNNNFHEYITNDKTKNFVITGSHVLDMIGFNSKGKFDKNLEGVRVAFLGELAKDKVGVLDIKALEKEEIDGLPEIVKARAASAKSQFRL